MWLQLLRPIPRVSRLLVALAVTGLLAGCQSSQPARSVAAPANASAVDSYKCAENLHNICGYMLEYYVVNRRLPATLEELRPFVDPDRTLQIICPVSAKPYQYIPAGVHSPRDPRLLVVYVFES